MTQLEAWHMPLLLVVACACFVGSFSIRMIDPLVPVIAADMRTAEANVSLLASAFAIPYALIQPVLGPIGDRVGKARVIKICLFFLMIAMGFAVVATTIEQMFAARILGGLAGGGIIPLAMAIVGDRVPFERRQVALSQILTASIGAMLLGTVGSGLLATLIGWRGVFAVALVTTGCVYVITMLSLDARRSTADGAPPASSAGLFSAYATVFANARAYVCFIAVVCEGVLVFGLLPFVASLLVARGAGGVVEAGFVLSGFAIGGIIYAQVGSRLIGRMGGVTNLIRIGSVFVVIGYFGVALQGSWGLEMAAFTLFGYGFFSIHNSLQTQATELAPQNRGASVSLFAFFFFLGQAAGPMLYAVALQNGEPAIVIAVAGVAAFCLANALAFALRRP
jgi:MFS transporter, DHA1 family, inner membrane transport protein